MLLLKAEDDVSDDVELYAPLDDKSSFVDLEVTTYEGAYTISNTNMPINCLCCRHMTFSFGNWPFCLLLNKYVYTWCL